MAARDNQAATGYQIEEVFHEDPAAVTDFQLLDLEISESEAERAFEGARRRYLERRREKGIP